MKRVVAGLAVLALVLGCGKKTTPSEEPAPCRPCATPQPAAKSATAPAATAAPVAPAGGQAMVGDGTPNNPVVVQKIADVTVNGDLSDWSKVAAFNMPFMKNKKSGVYLAWNEKGLYGAVQAVDSKIVIHPDLPWTGDCFELWLDKSFARGQDRDTYSTQLAFSPSADNKEGKGLVVEVTDSGDLETGPKGVECAWKKTPQGYNIEFFIPAAALKPAKLQPGTKIGLNFALDNDGEPIYQFFHDKNADEGYRNPSTWGAIVLK